MPYIMKMYVDSGCRRDDDSEAIGAAACVIHMKAGRKKTRTRAIDPDEYPTNKRAEITAIILALQQALARYDKLHSAPYLQVTIYTSSKYAQGCMSTWKHHTWKYPWVKYGWLKSRGNAVANMDLIQEASKLDEAVRELGDVEYVWISRSQNSEADEAVNSVMDLMEEISQYSPGWFYKVCFGCRFDSAWGLLTAWRDVVVRVGK
ncbi:hypothetical protein JMJ35_010360 [Cladonia borealis]|uniref:RNase H type-1 domain-containing protein n=1 Tax=Cladonia borealis TaxID=184061 RepID=A0AA39QQK9_9LECA|nr:hypothetical protein JMJ35_010360 [Cladonia borealis]